MKKEDTHIVEKNIFKKTITVHRFFFLLLFTSLSLETVPQRASYNENKTPNTSQTLYNSGDWNGAITEAKKEIEASPTEIESHIVLASSYLELKDYKSSYDVAKKGRENTQQRYHPTLLEIQAIACYNLGRNLEALSLLQTYLRITSQEKDVANIYYYMGEIYARLTQYNRADIALTAALSIRPSRVDWWARLGYVREKARTSKYDTKTTQYALEAYQKALSLDKNYSDAIAGINRLRGSLR